MEKIKHYEIDVKMALSGTKDMQNKLQRIMATVPELRNRFQDLGIDKVFNKQLDNMVAGAVSKFNKLENAMKALKKPEDFGMSEDDASAALIDSYREMLNVMAKTNIEMERLSQHSKSAFSAQEDEIQKTLTLLDKNKIKIKNLTDLYVEAGIKAEAANSVAPLAKFNRELDSRTQKLLKIKELLSTMKTLNLNSAEAKTYEAELQKIYGTLQDFNTPLKEAEAMMKGLKVNPKLLSDMQDFSKYTKGLKTDLLSAQGAMDKNSVAYKEMGVFLKQISAEQDKVTKGGRDEYTIAKKNVKLIEDRYNKYKMLNAQADNLGQQLLSNEKIAEGTRDAVNSVVAELRKAAVEQFDLTKGSQEYNATLTKALQFEAELNKNLKEKVATEQKLLALRTKMEGQLADIERLTKSKKPYATTESLKAANAAAKELEQKLAQINNLMGRVRNVGTIDGKVDSASLSKLKDETRAVTQEFGNTNLKIKEVKANLSELSSTKWGTNILKRAVAYASMYAGIYEVIALMRNGIDSVVEFDTQMRTIEAVFDVTSGTAKNLTQDLLNLGRAWGGSVTDINDAALALGRAGIATEKVAEATEVVIKMAKLTGDSIAVSASAVITYQQVFGATHPVLKEVGDQLAYVANQSRLSTQDIGTFSNYALAAASAAGISMEAINAMATSFSNAGVNASTIGTQIRRFSSLMKDNSTAAQEFFLKLGTTQEAFAAQMQKGKKSADEAMTWIASRLKSLSNSEFQKTIKGMDILASNSITLLRNNADEFLRHFTTLNEGVQGEIDKANLISDGYQASFEKMKAAASAAFISLGETAAPVIQTLLDDMAKFFDYIKNNSAAVLEKINLIVDIAKWAAMTLAISKVISMVSSFSTMVGVAATAIGPFVANMFALARGFGAATVAVRLFLASNPIGWAILAASAVGGAAIALASYGDEVDTVAEKQKKYNNLQTEAESLDKRIQNNRAELGQVMKLLNDTTHEATQAEINRAAKLEMAILKDEEHIKVLREKQKIQELNAKIKVGNTEIRTITQEIKLAEADGNQQLIGQLLKRKERLQQQIGTIKIKVGFEEAANSYAQGVTKLMDEIAAKQSTLDTLVSNGVTGIGLEQRTRELEALKAKLKETFNVDVNMFKGKDLGVELEKHLITLQGKLDAVKLYLKVTPNIDAATEAKLKEEVTNLQSKIADFGGKTNAVIGKSIIDSFSEMGNSIRNQVKAGLDVAPQLASFNQQFENSMNMAGAQAAGLAEKFNVELANAMANIPTDSVDAQFYELMQRVTEAEKEFANADTAKGKAVALNNLKNILAQLELQYGETGATAVSKVKEIINAYDDLNGSVQRLAGEMAKTQDLGGAKSVEKAEKLANVIHGMISSTENINMSYAEINSKLGTGIDLSWQIRNASLSTEQADRMRISTKATLIEMEQTLIQLAEAYNYIMSHAAVADAETKGALLVDLQNQMSAAIQKATSASKNFKALNGALKTAKGHAKSTASHAASAAKSAEKHAEQVERAQRALKKLEAGYRAIAGDYDLSIKLDVESELMKIDEMGRKAEASKEKIAELKALYVNSSLYDTKKSINQDSVNETGLDYLSVAKQYEARYQKLNEYYTRVEELQRVKEQELMTLRQEGAITQDDYERQRMELDLARQKEHLDKKAALDQAYRDLKAQTYGAMAGELAGVMETMYTTGLIKTKGWLNAMKALRVAEAIMSTYTAAANALAVGVPPFNYINVALTVAKGMAQVAQIKSQKFHTGGYTDKPLSSGVGGLKDDEINAVLKKGEYVLTQNEVASIKAANKRNTATPTPSEKQDTNKSESSSLQTRELAQLADSLKSEVVIVNSQDPAVIESWATSRRGREVINNIING